MTPEDSGRPRSELPSAISSFGEIAARLRGATPAVFLDYDGVLTPIVAHPDLAVIPPSMRDTVTRLATRVTVAVISGRDTEDVRAKVGVAGVYYAGSHGFDIVDPGGRPVGGLDRFNRYLAPLGAAADAIEDATPQYPGTHVERKRFAVAVHFRQADPAAGPELEKLVRQVARRTPGLTVTGGKKIFEVRPDVDWDKGRALVWLLRELDMDRPDVIPVYLGDDVTDEDAFRAIRASGIGIVVGHDGPPSLARYRLDDTAAVERLLTLLHDEAAP
ncbi:MAG TPA: trehalose-phosphatase [Acidimicrobiia bacterium]